MIEHSVSTGNKPIAVSGIHLWEDNKYVYVEVEIDGTWHKVIRELRGDRESSFSHIVEPDGIRQAMQKGVR